MMWKQNWSGHLDRMKDGRNYHYQQRTNPMRKEQDEFKGKTISTAEREGTLLPEEGVSGRDRGTLTLQKCLAPFKKKFP